MQVQKPGAQIMCAVRSSAIVLPKEGQTFLFWFVFEERWSIQEVSTILQSFVRSEFGNITLWSLDHCLRSLKSQWSWLEWAPDWHHGAPWRRCLICFKGLFGFCNLHSLASKKYFCDLWSVLLDEDVKVFRCKERVMQARQGVKVGKCMLFFGARYKQVPFLQEGSWVSLLGKQILPTWIKPRVHQWPTYPLCVILGMALPWGIWKLWEGGRFADAHSLLARAGVASDMNLSESSKPSIFVAVGWYVLGS